MRHLSTVVHSRGSYPVLVAGLAELRLSPQDVLLTDSNVVRVLSAQVPPAKVLVVPAGERSKSSYSYVRALEFLASHSVRRDGRVVAVGGGVVGDLAGFVAATYMRGIRLLQVPTSLLAMVDSSVGGKVGIDLRAGKNLAGSFYPPEAVWLMPDALKTLPRRHIRNGAAEVFKYGFISDPSLLPPTQAALKSGEWLGVVERSIRIKSAIVEADEFEQTGQRATLNFGHTIGHAIEHSLGYRHLLHGEAVSVGMALEAEYGERLGVTPSGLAAEVRSSLARAGLPVSLPKGLDAVALIGAMGVDKKAGADGLAMSLLTDLGACKLLKGIEASDLRDFLAPS